MAFHDDIVSSAQRNEDFRREVITGSHSQVVLMSVAPGEDIGEEVHVGVDQTLIFVAGEGQATLDGVTSPVAVNSLYFVPAGTRHNFVDTGTGPLQLYTRLCSARARTWLRVSGPRPTPRRRSITETGLEVHAHLRMVNLTETIRHAVAPLAPVECASPRTCAGSRGGATCRTQLRLTPATMVESRPAGACDSHVTCNGRQV